MKIAIATENNCVSGHFGGSKYFTFVEIDDTTSTKKVISKTLVEAPPHETGSFPNFIKSQGADLIIVGGMGLRAQQMLTAFNIKVYAGIAGTIDDTIQQFIAGTLQPGESFCNHHHGEGHHHHGEGHHHEDGHHHGEGHHHHNCHNK